MTAKQSDELEALRKKRDQLNAKIMQAEAREKERAKKEHAALLFVFGEMVEAAIKSDSMTYEGWEKLFNRHLPEGRKRELALRGLAALRGAEKPESPAKDGGVWEPGQSTTKGTEKPQDGQKAQDKANG